MIEKPILIIQYCNQCRWLLRAAWYAQECLTTFGDELGGVMLTPGVGGVFDVRIQNGVLIWSRQQMGGFPEIKELKQRVRDLINPAKDLGHSDR